LLLVNFPFIGFLYENLLEPKIRNIPLGVISVAVNKNLLEPKITNIPLGVISVAVNINLEYTILIHTFIKISIG